MVGSSLLGSSYDLLVVGMQVSVLDIVLDRAGKYV
jgi:hypothetical protein